MGDDKSLPETMIALITTVQTSRCLIPYMHDWTSGKEAKNIAILIIAS